MTPPRPLTLTAGDPSRASAAEEDGDDELLKMMKQENSHLHYAIGLDKLVLTGTERLVAFNNLHQSYASQPLSANPFLHFLVSLVGVVFLLVQGLIQLYRVALAAQIAGDDKAEKFERLFILQFLQLLELSDSSSIKEFLNLSAYDYVKSFDPSLHALPQIEESQQKYISTARSETFKCFFKDNVVKNVLADPDVPLGCDANSSKLLFGFDLQHESKAKLGSGERDETLIDLLVNLSLEGLGPQWIRPRPPSLPIKDGELVWLIPDNNHGIITGFSGIVGCVLIPAEVLQSET